MNLSLLKIPTHQKRCVGLVVKNNDMKNEIRTEKRNDTTILTINEEIRLEMRNGQIWGWNGWNENELEEIGVTMHDINAAYDKANTIVILNGFKESLQYVESLSNAIYIGEEKSDDGYTMLKCYETIE